MPGDPERPRFPFVNRDQPIRPQKRDDYFGKSRQPVQFHRTPSRQIRNGNIPLLDDELQRLPDVPIKRRDIKRWKVGVLSHFEMVPPIIEAGIILCAVRTHDESNARASHRPPANRSAHYPQSTLLRSLLDRRLMTLADRGGASGFVGSVWGKACTAWLITQIGAPLMWGEENIGIISSVLDVDALPGLASFASSRGLQNPDYLLTVESEDGVILVGADAKFSVETAKPRQVSTEIIAALVETEASPLSPLVPHYDLQADGFFLSPNYELTDLVLGGKAGILRVAVAPSDVVLIEPDTRAMFDRPVIADAMAALADLDNANPDWHDDLVTSLYYARCAFACLGCRVDEVKPLLGYVDQSGIDPDLAAAIVNRSARARSAGDLVLAWDRDAELIRTIRVRVHAAMDIGLMNRDLRTMIGTASAAIGLDPAPSINRIRRALGAWITTELVAELGVVHYPVRELEALLDRIRATVDLLRPEIKSQVIAIIAIIAAIRPE
jgi:hypothetical protein